ncbi:hypothetical protein D3C78_1985140 [compost metagenome]
MIHKGQIINHAFLQVSLYNRHADQMGYLKAQMDAIADHRTLPFIAVDMINHSR